MTCCPPLPAVKNAKANAAERGHNWDQQYYSQWVREDDDGLAHMDVLAPSIHCAACIQKIENGLKKCDGVRRARVNLSSKRVSLSWQKGRIAPGEIMAQLEGLGFKALPFDAAKLNQSAHQNEGARLLRAVAVAGFAAANIMLLSVSIWSGASDATRAMFHWLSALIALPVVLYAGQVFFSSAFNAVKVFRMNMDVPISLAVILATGLSLYETINGGEHAYFDAAVSLLFFLLIGRYLDYMMRAKAHSAISHLIALSASGAEVIDEDGQKYFVPIDEIVPGQKVMVAPGQRVPVDGIVLTGMSDLDQALVNGESLPMSAGPGDKLYGGTLNLSGPLVMEVSHGARDCFLASVVELMEQAESNKAPTMRLADRAAQIYAPAVHLVALVTFIGWLWASGGDWHHSLFIAISVLIITCPCALGLAVPVVQVVACGVLFRRGVMVKEGDALERLREIDHVVFDKTGTLTLGAPQLVRWPDAFEDQKLLSLALGLAEGSHHPLAKALVAAINARGGEFSGSHSLPDMPLEQSEEVPGAGMRAVYEGRELRLGKRSFIGNADRAAGDEEAQAYMELWFSYGDEAPICFLFEDALRADARETIAALRGAGMKIEILSGDRAPVVARAAAELGVAHYRAECTPFDKADYVASLGREGAKVLFVGDGINDGPALAAGHVSMAPSSASDLGRTAADLVFFGTHLKTIIFAYRTARAAGALVRQNFAFAAFYNLVAVPLAVLGFATPLFAAIAMSSSSLIVTLNALRLRLMKESRGKPGQEPLDIHSLQTHIASQPQTH